MNVFATDPDPAASARALDDRRLNKMIVESGQILSTALHLAGRGSPDLYHPAYPRHPIVLWAAADARNYAWLWRHLRALLAERAFRTGGRPHRTERLAPLLGAAVATSAPPAGFCNCTPHPRTRDVHRAYRQTLVEKWRRDTPPPRWTRRAPPRFWSRARGRS
jgi:hypothetical protein